MDSKVVRNRPKRPKFGGRKPGTPNKTTAEVRELAQGYTERALHQLAVLMEEGSSEAVRLAACREILDRAHGKPMQAIQVVEHVTQHVEQCLELTDEQRQAVDEILDFYVQGGPSSVERIK